jgi:hypothetical protein
VSNPRRRFPLRPQEAVARIPAIVRETKPAQGRENSAMERRSAWIVRIAGLVLLTTSGCGQTANTTSGPDAAGSASGGSGKALAKNGPDDAVREFLEAVRTGDDAKAAKMLTPVARAKTAELHMVVAPPGSPTAKFDVTEFEMVAEDGAHVASTWSDVDEDGNRHADQILWILRKETEGWRVAGMATKIFEDELPIILNFEDPQDMLRKQKLAEEEMARRATAAAANTDSQARVQKPTDQTKPR